jgi:hypothetical protein
MKDVYEVLRQKKLELSRLQKEVEALRVSAPLLSEDDEADKPTLARSIAIFAARSTGMRKKDIQGHQEGHSRLFPPAREAEQV